MPSSYRNVGSERRVQSSLCIAGCTIRHRRLSLHHPFCIYEVPLQTVREYPNIDEPIVSVRTDYRGASAEIIETQVTQILENSIAGIEGIEIINSTSRQERRALKPSTTRPSGARRA